MASEAQETAKRKVIGVINKADWCPACQANGARAMAAFTENNQDKAIHFVVNDVTSEETKKKSEAELKKHGLLEEIGKHKGTGVAYFFHSETKELITQVSVAKSDEELAETLLAAKKGLK